jgi:hypothetical protein
MNRLLFRLMMSTMLLASLVLGCGEDDPAKPVVLDPNEPVPDFSVLDVNPNSSTTGQPVSPRNYVGKVSAWYFGHAT